MDEGRQEKGQREEQENDICYKQLIKSLGKKSLRTIACVIAGIGGIGGVGYLVLHKDNEAISIVLDLNICVLLFVIICVVVVIGNICLVCLECLKNNRKKNEMDNKIIKHTLDNPNIHRVSYVHKKNKGGKKEIILEEKIIEVEREKRPETLKEEKEAIFRRIK